MKTLVLYVFSQINERVNKFIKNAIFLDPDVDFIVINNGSPDEVILPDYVIYVKSDNTGYDFGGWSKALLYNDLYKGYDSFIFVNSSASGPYLPSYFNGKWTDIFLNGLTDTVKLFGSSISTNSLTTVNDVESSSHVQSYIFSMNSETLLFLISKNIFTIKTFTISPKDTFLNREMKMSRYILDNGWNIGCMMSYYNGIDFRFLTTKPSDCKPFLGDPMVIKNVSDKLFNNFYEFVFINGSRFDFNIHGITIE
jgi:hypothetical protein